MNLSINKNEIIPLSEFSLSWRWDKSHNEVIRDREKALLLPLSEIESKRIFVAIDYWRRKIQLELSYNESDWMMASSETDLTIADFQSQLVSTIQTEQENVIINWDKRTTLQTTKYLFLRYWDDFCYPSSDDTTIISADLNWLIEYRHDGVTKIWTRNELVN